MTKPDLDAIQTAAEAAQTPRLGRIDDQHDEALERMHELLDPQTVLALVAVAQAAYSWEHTVKTKLQNARGSMAEIRLAQAVRALGQP